MTACGQSYVPAKPRFVTFVCDVCPGRQMVCRSWRVQWTVEQRERPQTINKIQECVIIYQLGRYILQQPSSPGLPVCWYKLSLCGGYISLYKDLSVTLTHLIVCQLFSESLIRKLEYLLNQIWTLWNAVLILFPTPNNEQTMAMVRCYISYS